LVDFFATVFWKFFKFLAAVLQNSKK